MQGLACPHQPLGALPKSDRQTRRAWLTENLSIIRCAKEDKGRGDDCHNRIANKLPHCACGHMFVRLHIASIMKMVSLFVRALHTVVLYCMSFQGSQHNRICALTDYIIGLAEIILDLHQIPYETGAQFTCTHYITLTKKLFRWVQRRTWITLSVSHRVTARWTSLGTMRGLRVEETYQAMLAMPSAPEMQLNTRAT